LGRAPPSTPFNTKGIDMSSPNAIEARLAALETTNRRLRHALTVLLVGGTCAIGVQSMREAYAAPPPPSPVSASAINLVDGAGKTRISMKMVGDQPSIHLYGADGKARSTLFLTKSGEGKMSMLDSGAVVRAIFGVNKGMAQMNLFGPEGKLRNSVTVSKKGDPNTFHFNAKTKVIGSIKNKKK
jgi:hypothetical protein